MPNHPDVNVCIADTFTLLLHNQHALAAAIEEVAKWLSQNGAEPFSINAVTALETLDKNAQSIASAIMRLRSS